MSHILPVCGLPQGKGKGRNRKLGGYTGSYTLSIRGLIQPGLYQSGEWTSRKTGTGKRELVSTSRARINPLAAIDAKMRHLHPPQVQALSRAH